MPYQLVAEQLPVGEAAAVAADAAETAVAAAAVAAEAAPVSSQQGWTVTQLSQVVRLHALLAAPVSFPVAILPVWQLLLQAEKGPHQGLPLVALPCQAYGQAGLAVVTEQLTCLCPAAAAAAARRQEEPWVAAVLRLLPDAAVACAEAASADEGHEKLPAEDATFNESQKFRYAADLAAQPSELGLFLLTDSLSR